MDFQREPQSKHHLYCEQEKPAHCHGSLLLRLGTHQIQNQRRTQNQPTRYYDQADASYELGPRGHLGWGSGLALAIWVGLGRVGQEVKKNNLRSKDDVWTVVLSESPWTANRHSPSKKGFLWDGSDGVDHVAREVLQHGVANRGSRILLGTVEARSKNRNWKVLMRSDFF